jgi:hypothetical protein
MIQGSLGAELSVELEGSVGGDSAWRVGKRPALSRR